jgi:hypothetical protein
LKQHMHWKRRSRFWLLAFHINFTHRVPVLGPLLGEEISLQSFKG